MLIHVNVSKYAAFSIINVDIDEDYPVVTLTHMNHLTTERPYSCSGLQLRQLGPSELTKSHF